MFLEGIPLTAYAICYGPLLITVVGFVVFAVLTDTNARRTYLRRDIKEPRRDRARTAEIPEGSVITIEPITGEVAMNAPLAPAPAPTTPAPPAPAAAAPPEVVSEPVVEDPSVGVPPPPEHPPGEQDELTRLEGIGPKVASALVAGGLDTFEKVAAATEDDYKAALSAAGLNFTPSMESWAEQAGYAARGDWEGLAELQATLISGRYPPKDE